MLCIFVCITTCWKRKKELFSDVLVASLKNSPLLPTVCGRVGVSSSWACVAIVCTCLDCGLWRLYLLFGQWPAICGVIVLLRSVSCRLQRTYGDRKCAPLLPAVCWWPMFFCGVATYRGCVAIVVIVRTCRDCGLSIGLHSAVCLCFLRMIICVMQPTYGNRMAT